MFQRGAVLMSAQVDDELVALDEPRGLCFGLNGPAAEIYTLACEGRSETEIVDTLIAEFEVDPATCALEVAEMLDELCREGLLTPAGDAATP